VVINTARNPETLLKWISPKENMNLVKAVACIDANALGAGVMLTFDGTEGSGDDTKVGAGVGAAIAGAVAKATGCVKLDSLVNIAENKIAVKQGFEKVIVLPLCKGEAFECGMPEDPQEIKWR
jgi:pyruvate ferredoxin oxidoreductase gamma subunit/oxalate oxidoreductase subunit delta